MSNQNNKQQNKSSFANFYDQIQAWHLVVFVVLGFSLFLLIAIFEFKPKQSPIEHNQLEVINKIIRDYDKFYDGRGHGDGELFIATIKLFGTDTSYKNWDRAKGSLELTKVLTELELAEHDMDKLKKLVRAEVARLEDGGQFSQEQVDEIREIIKHMQECTDRAKQVLYSN